MPKASPIGGCLSGRPWAPGTQFAESSGTAEKAPAPPALPQLSAAPASVTFPHYAQRWRAESEF